MFICLSFLFDFYSRVHSPHLALHHALNALLVHLHQHLVRSFVIYVLLVHLPLNLVNLHVKYVQVEQLLLLRVQLFVNHVHLVMLRKTKQLWNVLLVKL
jgi:hypothetical protein